MEFASPYAYISCNTSDFLERVSDDEFNSGMTLSDSEEEIDIPMPMRVKSLPANKIHHWQTDSATSATDSVTSSTSKERWFRQADTNVVSVDFETLKKTGNMHAGDPVSCEKCIAILSHISQLTTEEEEKKWKCEFCGKVSVVDVEDEEIPKAEDLTYLLQPAMATSHSTISGVDKSLVIFCMDTSGSMCVTSEISGRVRLRGNSKLRRLQSFNEGHESQYLPNQRQDVTYVSRLQSMQAAVDHQLVEMQKSFPNRRVALIAFCNEVCVIGDGSQTEVILAGDKLNNEAQLTEESCNLSLPGEVKNSRECLSNKVYKLEEGGATALGPALIVALSMASHHPGSKVIVCTDGKANIGLGKMENDEDEENAEEFYTNLGEKALQSGVTVSVITIQGTDCKLVHLGKLADKTGGQVNIVDPLKLQEEFSNIMKDPIIATKVKATFILYKDLYVHDELNPKNQQCRAEKFIGNVTKNSRITFQFAKRRETKSKKSRDQKKNSSKDQKDQENSSEDQKGQEKQADPACTAGATGDSNAAESVGNEENPESLPFQLQIEYIDTEGNKALRVITRSLPVTADRSMAERDVNLDVIGVHAARQSSDLALRGEYSSSRGVALMNQRLAYRHTSYTGDTDGYRGMVRKLCRVENTVHEQQMREIRSTGQTYSGSEASDDELVEVADVAAPPKETTKGKIAKLFKKSRGKKEERSREMSDDMAKVMYQALSTTDANARRPKTKHSEKDRLKKTYTC